MAVNKCLKCGAAIPEGAEFCPGCGAPKGVKAVTQQVAQPAQPMQTQQPMYQQPMVKTGDPLKNLAGTLFSTKLMTIFILIGILIVFIGMIIWTIGYPGIDDAGDPDNYGMLKPAAIISYLGFFMIAGVSLIGGMLNNKLNSYVRLGLILTGAFILMGLISAINPVTFLPWSGLAR